MMAEAGNWEDLLVIDPTVSKGRERSIRGAGFSASAVLHLLSLMNSEDEVISYVSSLSMPGASRELTRGDVRACAAFGGNLARNRRLSPPAAARFARDQGNVGENNEEEVRPWAATVLGATAEGLGRQEMLDEHEELSDEMVRKALAYGAVLASDEDLPTLGESPEERYMRGQLSTEDRQLVEDFCKYHWSIGVVLLMATPEDWLGRWRQTVERVEAVYSDDIHELTNSLATRDLLEDLTSLLTPPGQDALRRDIRPWDERYDAATRAVSVSLMGNQVPWRPKRWWWYRVPVRLGRELADDLRVLGIAGDRIRP